MTESIFASIIIVVISLVIIWQLFPFLQV